MFIIWPEVFTTGKIYTVSKEGKAQAVADGLCGWANCMSGNTPPPEFGEGMTQIGSFLGIVPLAENLHKLADEIIKGKENDL